MKKTWEMLGLGPGESGPPAGIVIIPMVLALAACAIRDVSLPVTLVIVAGASVLSGVVWFLGHTFLRRRPER
ncbi:hypothetical protein [Aeromicrobium sp. Leaf350]|uniref:hypothetical protein n=1 Tax=Aeromicrobium sp. Leaf350 TaxID=2876565 RepID=UPI001E2D179F|nr:hypothetical protein [Aeromicrobium sp. Leaf350]